MRDTDSGELIDIFKDNVDLTLLEPDEQQQEFEAMMVKIIELCTDRPDDSVVIEEFRFYLRQMCIIISDLLEEKTK